MVSVGQAGEPVESASVALDNWGAENLVAVKNNKKSSLDPFRALDDLKSYCRAR